MLDRAPLTPEQQAQLGRLAAAGGLVRLRLPSAAGAGAPLVSTSFPVHCMAAAGADGGLALDMLDAAHVAALALNAPCSRGAAAAPGDVQLPASQTLALRLPAAAPEVVPQLVPGQVAADAAAALGGLQRDGGAPGAQRGQQQGAPGGKAGAAGQGEGKKAPQPDDRTWLQKNWMLVLPLVFIVSAAGSQAAPPAARCGCQAAPGCSTDALQPCTAGTPVFPCR